MDSLIQYARNIPSHIGNDITGPFKQLTNGEEGDGMFCIVDINCL